MITVQPNARLMFHIKGSQRKAEMVVQELWKNYWSSLLLQSSVRAGIPREIPTTRPYVCGNKREQFLYASLFFLSHSHLDTCAEEPGS